jgi:hypothetical protein
VALPVVGFSVVVKRESSAFPVSLRLELEALEVKRLVT